VTADPAPADAQENALGVTISVSTPEVATPGGTPTHAALAGALEWATSYQATEPDETTVVVFVTDGEPNGCNEDWDDITDLSADALTTANVRTFAVGLTDQNGVGVNQGDLNRLAEAGGTEQAYVVADGANASLDLLATLNAIRGRL
jgi:uncharacterized protein YegL